MTFDEFKNLLEEEDIHMLVPQAKRAFLAVEIQGDGQLGNPNRNPNRNPTL